MQADKRIQVELAMIAVSWSTVVGGAIYVAIGLGEVRTAVWFAVATAPLLVVMWSALKRLQTVYDHDDAVTGVTH